MNLLDCTVLMFASYYVNRYLWHLYHRYEIRRWVRLCKRWGYGT